MLAGMLGLGACAHQAVPPAPPADLRSCEEPPPTPRPPPRVRPVHETAKFAIALELAREAERARGDDCADRLRRLNDWIAARR